MGTKQQQQPASTPPYRPCNPNTGNHQKARWGPQGQMAMQASSSVPDRVEIARLQAVIANMNGMPSAPTLTLTSPSCHQPPDPAPSTVGFMGSITPMMG